MLTTSAKYITTIQFQKKDTPSGHKNMSFWASFGRKLQTLLTFKLMSFKIYKLHVRFVFKTLAKSHEFEKL